MRADGDRRTISPMTKGADMSDAIEGGISGAIEEIIGNLVTGSLGGDDGGTVE